MLNKPICSACGTQFSPDRTLPELCPICNDDRQYIGDTGQHWTEMDSLNKSHTVEITKINEQLYTFKMTPDFAIGQRAFLVLSSGGNILWDCIPLLNEAVIAFIELKGGLKAIAFSHPHYYSSMTEWACVFNCPIYIHQSDEQWINYQSKFVQLWNGNNIHFWDGISIINVGGHFPGSSLLRVSSLSAKGTVLCGDSLYISRSKRHVAVMYSYPNQILLGKKEFVSFFDKVKDLEFDTLRGAFEWQNLIGNAGDIFITSMKRYRDDYEVSGF